MSLINNIYVFIFFMMGATVFSKGTALVSFCLIMFVSVFYCYKNRVLIFKDFRESKFIHIFLLFTISSIFSGAIGLNPQKSIISMIFFIVISLIYHPIKKLLLEIKKEDIKKLPKVIVYTITPFCLFSIVKEIWLMQALNLEFKRHFPMVIALVSPFYWFYFLKNSNQISSYIFLAIFVLSLVVGDNRGAVFSTIIGSLIFTLLYKWDNKKQFVKIALSGFVLLSISFAVYINTNPKAYERVFSSKIEKISSGRNVLWKFSYDKIKEKPIFGYGPKTFKYQDFTGYKVNTKTHPHNIVLETILETGVIGFLIVLYWLFNLIKEFKLSYNKNDECSTIFMLFSLSFILYFIINLTSVSIHRIWFTIFPLYFLLMANVIKIKITKVS